MRFDPPATADAVTPVTRITVELAAASYQPPRAMLVAGALSASQLRDFGKPVVPQTLASRAVSTLVWLEADATHLVVAPLAALEPGALYTLALSSPLVSLPFTVAAESPTVLARVWPDHDEVAPSARAAVWCGISDLGALDVPATLEPALLAGRFTVGTGAPVSVPYCVSWFSAAPPLAPDANAPPALAPPAVTFDDGSRATLEPTVLFDHDGPPVVEATCVAPSIPFGPGCADVEDDRLVVRPGVDPLLWTVDFGQLPVVHSSRGSPFTLRPLPADGRCAVTTLDRSGRVSTSEVHVVPGEPRAHVVLNEVLANPAGVEPAQEWVELYNDGAGVVSLAGFALEDAGGRSIFPDGVLAPGSFALVVSDAFVADDGVDPPPASGTVLVRVAMLGRSGLSNDGEKLTLRDAAGAILSTFPAVKTKNGSSIARTAPDAVDDDPASFIPSPNGSSTPGAPNVP
jgi:hypothetical protein